MPDSHATSSADLHVLVVELAKRRMSQRELARKLGCSPAGLFLGIQRGSWTMKWAIEATLGCAVFSEASDFQAAVEVKEKLGWDPRFGVIQALRATAKNYGLHFTRGPEARPNVKERLGLIRQLHEKLVSTSGPSQ